VEENEGEENEGEDAEGSDLDTEDSDFSDDEEFNQHEEKSNKDEEEEKENQVILDEIIAVLYKMRSIIKMTRKSNNIQSHVWKLMESDELTRKVSFILDFFVRWNSTYLMIKRFKSLKKFANALTTSPERIDGIKIDQIKKLEKLHFSSTDWMLVDTLYLVLKPFYDATKLLSGQNYPTLSIAHVVYKSLTNHLQNSTEYKESIIKRILIKRLYYHFHLKLSSCQRAFTLVSKKSFCP